MSVNQTGENLIGKGKAGPGRPKGVPNRQTTKIKDMITEALSQAGGVQYLARQAEENPGPFLALVGKVMPMQLVGSAEDGGHKIIVSWEK
jgi:hypothetical protein